MTTIAYTALILGLAVGRVGAAVYSYQLQATTEGQSFSSPNYPGEYDADSSITWLIYTNITNKVIYLDVTDSYIEYRYNCAWDYVMVFDGSGVDTNHLGTFCGGARPTYYSSGTYLYVIFKSDSSLQYRGFHMVYQAVDPVVPVAIIVGGVIGACLIVGLVFIIIYMVKQSKTGSRPRRPLTRVTPAPAAFTPSVRYPGYNPWTTSSSLGAYSSPPPLYTSPPPPQQPKPPPPYTSQPPPRYSSLGFVSPDATAPQELSPVEAAIRDRPPPPSYGGYGTGTLAPHNDQSASDW